MAITDIKNSATGTTQSFSNIVNTEEYAKTICSNSQYLDDKTRNMVDAEGPAKVKEMLDDITVVTGADRDLVKELAKDIGYSDTMADLISQVDAFSINGTVFFFEDSTSFKKSDDKYLAKHEAIHYLQSEAEGGMVEFLGKYQKSIGSGSTADYLSSKYEKAAYSFGPSKGTKSNYNPNGLASVGHIK